MVSIPLENCTKSTSVVSFGNHSESVTLSQWASEVVFPFPNGFWILIYIDIHKIFLFWTSCPGYESTLRGGGGARWHVLAEKEIRGPGGGVNEESDVNHSYFNQNKLYIFLVDNFRQRNPIVGKRSNIQKIKNKTNKNWTMNQGIQYIKREEENRNVRDSPEISRPKQNACGAKSWERQTLTVRASLARTLVEESVTHTHRERGKLARSEDRGGGSLARM